MAKAFLDADKAVVNIGGCECVKLVYILYTLMLLKVLYSGKNLLFTV